MGKYIMALDAGTTSNRCILFDQKGQIVSLAQKEFTQHGTFSLEIMELLWEKRPHAHIFWFSDLDFALRAYRYNADWFGKKPVDIHSLRKAFGQILYRRECL